MTVSRPCFVMCVRTRTENMWRTRRGSIEIETNALALPQNSSTFMFRSFVCDVCLPATPCCTKVTLMVQCNTFTQSLFCSPLKMEWRTSPNGEHCALNGIRMCCCGFDFYNNILDRPQSADNSFSVIFFFVYFFCCRWFGWARECVLHDNFSSLAVRSLHTFTKLDTNFIELLVVVDGVLICREEVSLIDTLAAAIVIVAVVVFLSFSAQNCCLRLSERVLAQQQIE